MKPPTNRMVPVLSSLVLAGALGLAIPAWAENAAPAGGGAPPAASGIQGGKEGAAAAPNGAATTAAPSGVEWVEREVDRLHRQLKITPAQEPMWTQFAETMRAHAEHMQQFYHDRSEHFETMSALDNLKNYQQILQLQSEDLAKKIASFQTLYASLSPEQKQTADRIFRYQEERREQRHMARHG